MTAILKHQVVTFVKNAEPEDVKDAWNAAPQTIKDQVLALLDID